MPSMLYTTLIEDFLKLSKPNSTLVNRLCYYPLFSNNSDDVILDAGFCKTSIDSSLYSKIEEENCDKLNNSDNDSFLWVMTQKRIYIVNEKWVFGFSISIASIKCTNGFNPTPTRGKLIIEGLIDSSSLKRTDSIVSKDQKIKLSIKGSSAGFRNIFHWIDYINSINNNFKNKETYGFGNFPKP